MSGFIAGGQVPGDSVPGSHINSDPFWPSIDLDSLRATLRIDSSVTLARLETAVVAAILSVNRDLAKWRVAKQSEGFTALTEVPDVQIQGKSQLMHLYVRAVECAAGAEVCERYRGYDTTASGSKNTEEDTPTIDDYRRDQRWAIRDFLGKSRTTVELL
ncbi:head completion/stabilization protein [Pseudomonas asiatica]|uniref:head completion/stabilization protein n=1 Tax=Pseudomonas asiatica TaxID=2219225 RepID=UPI00209A7E29|nr:head completion/stabilization protein [Pseudomonas asiatica]MCO7537810.1 head completion/stabilization protein [Pseudomonas asiatica]MCO7551696.1 head completion/stabilization protein [Pseudomonas asiatica]MCO7562483.1 head completion/stabilization protein [Pseudomonas asiatica]